MYSKFYSPNIIAVGSSKLDQSSYSHHADVDVGVAVIDRFTYYNLEFLENQVQNQSSKLTLGDLFDSYDESAIHSTPGFSYERFPGGEQAGRNRLVMDFFGNVQNVEVSNPEATSDATWKEDLAALERLVKAMQEANETSTLLHLREPEADLPPASPASKPAIGFKVEQSIQKQAAGAAVILGGLGMWFVGSLLSKKA